MKPGYCVIAVLLLLPAIGLAQEPRNAEEIRTSKEFNNILAIFKESQLVANPDQHPRIYRIQIAPTFYHPISIRIEQNKNQY
jgi:hypothetical protein